MAEKVRGVREHANAACRTRPTCPHCASPGFYQ